MNVAMSVRRIVIGLAAAATAAAALACSSSTTGPARDAGPLIAEGWQLYESGDFGAAGGRFAAAIDADPRSAAAHAGFGFSRARQRDYHSSAASFALAIDLDPDSPEAFAGLALVEAARNDYAAVVAPATVLFILAPDYVHPHDGEINARAVRLVRAQAYYHAGDYSRAAADLDFLDPAAAPHSADPQALLAALADLSGLGSSL